MLEEQRRRFDRAGAALGAMGLRGALRHAANSAALLRDERVWYDRVRPGLLLYGIVPPPLAAGNLDLRPALSLTSRIVAVKGLRPGEGTGYGLHWAEDRPRRSRLSPRDTPMDWTRGWRDAASSSSVASAAPSSVRFAWT